MAAAKRVRPVRFRQLAARLVAAREARDWTQSDAAEFAARKHLRYLTRQVLLRLERGQTKDPHPKALRDAAVLYDIPYGELVGLTMSEKYGVSSDLIDHARTEPSTSDQGGPDDPTTARLLELKDRIEELQPYESIIEQIRPLLGDIIAIVGEESIKAAANKTARRGGHRAPD